MIAARALACSMSWPVIGKETYIFMIGVFETLNLKENATAVVSQSKEQTLPKQETNVVTKTKEPKPIFKFSLFQPKKENGANIYEIIAKSE